jgi:DNA-binding CsgD family transcriptional regulator
LARKLLGEFARPAPVTPARNVAHDEFSALTEREREALDLLVQGITSNRELAERLVITENTVKYHFRNILDKLHVQNRAQVVGIAMRHGMAEPPAQARSHSKGLSGEDYSVECAECGLHEAHSRYRNFQRPNWWAPTREPEHVSH